MNIRRTDIICSLLLIMAMLLTASCSSQKPIQNQNKRLAEAKRDVGEAYMHQGNYTAALQELLEAEKLNPEGHIVQNDLGICYMNKKRIPEAITHFKKAITLKPGYAPARNNLGTAYLTLKEWDKAIAIFKEISRDALYATPHYPLSNMGLAYYHKGQYNIALRYFKEALKLHGNFVNALRGAGRTYLAMGQGQLAIQYLERAVRLAPKSPDIHFELAEANLLIGQKAQAAVSYKTVIELAMPEDDIAKKAKRRLRSIR